MNVKKTKWNWKKIFGIILATIISAGSFAGMGYGAYRIYQSTNISNDFSEGHSIQLSLRLYKTDENGQILLDNNNKPIKIYPQDQEEEKIKNSAKALTNILSNRGLNNIKVSYGYSNTINDMKVNNVNVFANGVEPIAILYASFENAMSAFGLSDVDDPVNKLLNNKKIFESLNSSFAYEVELVKPSYSNPTGNYKINRYQSTNRKNSSLLTNEQHVMPPDNKNIQSISYFDIDIMKGNKINVFVDRDNKTSSNYISYTLNDELAYSYWNCFGFGEDNKQYQELKKLEDGNNSDSGETTYTLEKEGESTGDGSTETPPAPPTESQKFQTSYTWFLWKDKQGLIDYLNSLISLWYFNLYANKVSGSAFEGSANKTEILSKLFPTEDKPEYIRNSTLSSVRNQINAIINNLSEVEKSFIGSVVLSNGKPNSNDPLGWTPPLIKENDLIPVLYNFLNDKIFSPVTPINPNDIPSDNKDGVSQSVKEGWSFLESTNTDLQSFIGKYYAGTIDYRNFNVYFESPIKPEEPEEGQEPPIPEPFVTNQLRFDSLSQFNQQAEDFANTLNNSNYMFPIINPQVDVVPNSWGRFINGETATPNSILNDILVLNKKFEEIDSQKPKPNDPNYDQKLKEYNEKLKAFNEEKEKFANNYFVSNNLFSEQFITPASISSSVISSSLNPLYILLIVIGAIVFLVGIFVSIRYRIPGIFAFITSGLVFVLSALFYNLFGYLFSFYSVLALAVGTFLSFIVPSFLFRNIEKEVSEGSTLSAAILKSTKKYWKMSLDTHVMAILASLSFLFFGRNGNVNFGAMLIISVFLSFILSGIIYFILLLFYVYAIQFSNNTWFVSNRLFNKLSTNNKIKKLYLYNKLSFFNKPSYIVMGALLILGLVGSILVSINGPFFSIDFSNSSMLIINNFDSFNLSQAQIIDSLGITSTNAYVFDNQLVIYTYNNLDIDKVLSTLNSLIKPELSQSLCDNLNITTLTNELAIRVVKNTLECMGIAIGFCAVWSLLSLNIVSVIPFALIQAITMLITVGITSLVALPIDLNSIASYIFVFIISSAFSASLISSIKTSWDRKTMISRNDLKQLLNSIVSKINPNYIAILSLVLVFTIFSMALGSTQLIFPFVVLIFGSAYLAFANNTLLVSSWFGFVLIRNIFNKELLKTRNEKLHHVHDYDSVNEQKIVGINY